MKLDERLIQEACERTKEYVRQGFSLDDAVRIAVDDFVPSSAPTNVGQVEILAKAAEAEPVRKIRETVSPWLWILSIVGFGLAILNARRIGKIYGSWKVGRKAIKEGRAPEL